jgi:hypothetical protein
MNPTFIPLTLSRLRDVQPHDQRPAGAGLILDKAGALGYILYAFSPYFLKNQ